MTWKRKHTEEIHFYMNIDDDRRVVLARGGRARVSGVSVRFRRRDSEPWDDPAVSVSHGTGWGLTVTSVPRGLRGNRLPDWLAELVAEVHP